MAKVVNTLPLGDSLIAAELARGRISWVLERNRYQWVKLIPSAETRPGLTGT